MKRIRRVVVIAGNVGVGKSTLFGSAMNDDRFLNFTFIEEPCAMIEKLITNEDHIFDDEENRTKHLQVTIGDYMYDRLLKSIKENEDCDLFFCDRTFLDTIMFSYALGVTSEHVYQRVINRLRYLYKRYGVCFHYFPIIGVCVETIMENICKRGREFEEVYTEDYISALNVGLISQLQLIRNARGAMVSVDKMDYIHVDDETDHEIINEIYKETITKKLDFYVEWNNLLDNIVHF